MAVRVLTCQSSATGGWDPTEEESEKHFACQLGKTVIQERRRYGESWRKTHIIDFVSEIYCFWR